jgi:hypothetical protein
VHLVVNANSISSKGIPPANSTRVRRKILSHRGNPSKSSQFSTGPIEVNIQSQGESFPSPNIYINFKNS